MGLTDSSTRFGKADSGISLKTGGNSSESPRKVSYDEDNHEDGKDEAQEDTCDWVDDNIAEEEECLAVGLIGKLWSERVLNPTAFITTIKNVWMLQHGVDINMIGKNTFQFQFYHWKDKEKVLMGQPWHFDKIALLLSEMNEAQKPLDIQFFGLPIWARVYNVPFRGRHNDENIRILGDKIGEYIDTDRTENMSMEKSLRIRVSLDVRKPLKKHITLKIWGGELCTGPIKYEKLPLICFYCGKLAHGTNECKEVFGDQSPVKNYGSWLKALPWKPMKVEEEANEANPMKNTGRKLFFTRKSSPPKPVKVPSHVINSVTSLLDKVALDKDDVGPDRSSVELEATVQDDRQRFESMDGVGYVLWALKIKTRARLMLIKNGVGP